MIHDVIISKLKIISDERGKVMHMLRSDDDTFKNFGEIYFSTINYKKIKAWHLHKEATLNYVCIKGKVKLVILSSNCPSDTVNFAEGSKANVHKFNGNNATLGAACGKPFPVAAVAIVNDGKSDILELK